MKEKERETFIQDFFQWTHRRVATPLASCDSVGKAVVCLPDGSRPTVQWSSRETAHPSHTPKARAAVVKFAHPALDAEAISMHALLGSACEEALP